MHKLLVFHRHFQSVGGCLVKKSPVLNMPVQMLTIAEAVHDLQAGRMVILCDDEERENEADICIAAQFATPEKINFIVRQACGLLCVAMSGERLDALRLPLVEVDGHPLQGTAFTTSVDAVHGT